ncbi:MAG: acetyl-CoA carboxylase biotin carboxyl carrier protein subunit [Anaerolineae bacterium]
MKYIATVRGQDFEIDVDRHGTVVVDGEEQCVDLRPIDGAYLYSLIIDKVSYEIYVERREGAYYVLIEGEQYEVDVDQERLKKLKAFSGHTLEDEGAANIEAPMPGLVVRVLAAPGDEVSEGQGLLILEAMKMENEIRSPCDGVVQSVSVAPGAAVDKGDTLMVIENQDADADDGDEDGAAVALAEVVDGR